MNTNKNRGKIIIKKGIIWKEIRNIPKFPTGLREGGLRHACHAVPKRIRSDADLRIYRKARSRNQSPED